MKKCALMILWFSLLGCTPSPFKSDSGMVVAGGPINTPARGTSSAIPHTTADDTLVGAVSSPYIHQQLAE